MDVDSLEGTRWALEYLTLDEVSHMVSGRRVPELAFLGGRASVDDGVNRANGPYHCSPQRFSVNLQSSTRAGYPAERLPEHDLFAYLALANRATVHGDFLHVAFDGGELVYRWMEDEEPA